MAAITLVQKYPTQRGYPTYRVEVTTAAGVLLDLSHAPSDVTVTQSFGYRAGTLHMTFKIGKATADGQLLAQVQKGQEIKVFQVALNDPQVFQGTIDRVDVKPDGQLLSGSVEARDESAEVMCHQVDLVLTVATPVSTVVTDLLNLNAPGLAKSISASTFVVEPITFRKTSLHAILTYLAFISGERWFIDAGTLTWSRPNPSAPLATTLTTMGPDPTIAREGFKVQEDETQLRNEVTALTDGAVSDTFTHEVVGDGVTSFYAIPYKVADPIASTGAISVSVKNRFTGNLVALSVGVAYREKLSGGAVLNPSVVTAPHYRTATGIDTSGGVILADGEPPPIVGPPIHNGAYVISLGIHATGAGTGGKGDVKEAIVQTMPLKGTLGVTLAQPLTKAQVLVVEYKTPTPQVVKVTDSASVADNGTAQATAQGPIQMSAGASIQYAAAVNADLGRPVTRGTIVVADPNVTDWHDPIGKTVRVQVPERGIDAVYAITGQTKVWREGEVLKQTLEVGPPDYSLAFPSVVRKLEERITILEGAAVKTEAIT